METFVTHPQQDGPFPPVLFYMDVLGVRDELYDLARRVATVGYYFMLPDFYYRQGKIRFTFVNDKGERISLSRLSKEDQAKVLVPASKLSDAMVVADSGAILAFLRDGGEPVKPDAVGSIGYCMGGRHVMAVAVQYPERFKASASLHGTTLISDKPDSPHLRVADLQGELYCGFAEGDYARSRWCSSSPTCSSHAGSGTLTRSTRAPSTATRFPTAISSTRTRRSATGSSSSQCFIARSRPTRAKSATRGNKPWNQARSPTLRGF